MTHTLTTWSQCMTASGLSARTVDERVKLIRRLAQLAGGDVDTITRDHVLAHLGRRGFSQWTRCTYYQHIQAWAAFSGRDDLLDGISHPKTPRRLPDPLLEAELELLLHQVADDQLLTAWVLLGAYSGLRVGEVATLEGHMIRAEELRLTGKGDRVDVLPLPPVLQAALTPWTDTRGRLWTLSPRALAARVKRQAEHAGIERMRFHRLRHRFGTALYAATRDLLLTQRLMRHANPSTTAGYAALVDDDGRHAVNHLPGATPTTKE